MLGYNDVAVAGIGLHAFEVICASATNFEKAPSFDCFERAVHHSPVSCKVLACLLMHTVEYWKVVVSGGSKKFAQVGYSLRLVEALPQQNMRFALCVEKVVVRINEEDCCFFHHCCKTMKMVDLNSDRRSAVSWQFIFRTDQIPRHCSSIRLE
jgi:hypothetical protein